MSQEGLQSLYPLEDIAVMGIWELLPHLNKIRVRTAKLITYICVHATAHLFQILILMIEFGRTEEVEGNN